MKASAVKKLSTPLAGLEKWSRVPCEYELRLQNAFDPDPNCSGWRLLGRAAVWRIEEAIEADDWERAVTWTIVATRFGFDLAQGDSQSATLGFAIVSDARKAIAPHLEQLSAATLAKLSQGTSNALAKYKGLRQTLEGERSRMLFGVQFVQDCRQKKDYKELDKHLGRTVKQAVTYLRDLDESKRAAYFEGFADEAKGFVDHWQQQVQKARPDRVPWSEPAGARPWKRFAKAFCGTVEPLVDIADESVTRTRLLAVTAWALSAAKSTGSAPTSLKGLQTGDGIDPYSGRPLVYSASGADFKVYSVGVDGRDDGGDSDGSANASDIVLESGSN